MRLVPAPWNIFSTIQGDGLWQGLPMVFVRLWGCDYHCGWTDSSGKTPNGSWQCDTKDSWREGSPNEGMTVQQMLAEIRRCNMQHVSITGGNPMVQGEELVQLVDQLTMDHKILVETQASICDAYTRDVLSRIDLASLSPKLHDWRQEPLDQIMHYALTFGADIQVKIVVDSEEAVAAAIGKIEYLDFTFRRQIGHGYSRERQIIFYLLPEWKAQRTGVEAAKKLLFEWAEKQNAPYPVVRITGQLHKSYFRVV